MLLPMRTTIDINAVLFRAAKRRAAERGTSLRDVVEAALRQHLGKRPPGVATGSVGGRNAAESSLVWI